MVSVNLTVNVNAYNGHYMKIPKGRIRNRKSKKDRQCNGQKKKDKRTDNDLPNITQKTRAIRKSLKTEVTSGAPVL
jgi:hypothetical protein